MNGRESEAEHDAAHACGGWAAGAFEHGVGDGAAKIHGAGAAFFQASVVEESVGIGVDEFVRELRRYRRIDCETADGAGGDAAENLLKPGEVHRFLKDVLHDF